MAITMDVSRTEDDHVADAGATASAATFSTHRSGPPGLLISKGMLE